MKCPYCDKEMTSGMVQSGRQIFFTVKAHKFFFVPNATNNKNKLHNMCYWLKDYPDKSILPSGVNTHLQIDENGQTAVENAQLKLKAYYEVLNMPVIAGDSAKYIDGMFAEKQGNNQTPSFLEIVSRKIVNKIIKNGSAFHCFLVIQNENLMFCNIQSSKEDLE